MGVEDLRGSHVFQGEEGWYRSVVANRENYTKFTANEPLMRGEGDDRKNTDPKEASGKIYRETSKILQTPLPPSPTINRKIMTSP